MFKIEEEEEDTGSQDTEEGLTMIAVKKQDVIKPSTVTLKNETKITNQHPVYEYDPVSVLTLPSTFALPRVESVKGILRTNSAKTLDRIDSSSKLRPTLSRVESLKSIDPNKINKVLARVPHRSASFLNIPAYLIPEKPPLIKSKSTVGVPSLITESELKLSSLPDTPIIKSNNLPRFFADTPPPMPEFKEEHSLQSIKQRTTLMFKENDYSMPRYYGTVKSAELCESKSMPDLRYPNSTGKVSKRLVKLRSRLKPLVIRKSSEERL